MSSVPEYLTVCGWWLSFCMQASIPSLLFSLSFVVSSLNSSLYLPPCSPCQPPFLFFFLGSYSTIEYSITETKINQPWKGSKGQKLIKIIVALPPNQLVVPHCRLRSRQRSQAWVTRVRRLVQVSNWACRLA